MKFAARRKVNFKSKTAQRSSKFKIILRLWYRQYGKFIGAAIASTAVWRRDAIERVPKLADTELPICRRAVS